MAALHLPLEIGRRCRPAVNSPRSSARTSCQARWSSKSPTSSRMAAGSPSRGRGRARALPRPGRDAASRGSATRSQGQRGAGPAPSPGRVQALNCLAFILRRPVSYPPLHDVNSGSDAPRAWADVDLAAIVANARTVASVSGPGCFPMVKANGYGLGAVPVAGPSRRSTRGASAWRRWRRAPSSAGAGIARPIVVFSPLSPATRRCLPPRGPPARHRRPRRARARGSPPGEVLPSRDRHRDVALRVPLERRRPPGATPSLLAGGRLGRGLHPLPFRGYGPREPERSGSGSSWCWRAPARAPRWCTPPTVPPRSRARLRRRPGPARHLPLRRRGRAAIARAGGAAARRGSSRLRDSGARATR